MSFSAALMCFMKRVSMVLFLKELLQWSTKAESSMVTTSTSSNQVEMAVSAKPPARRRSSTTCQTSATEFKENAPFVGGNEGAARCGAAHNITSLLYQRRREKATVFYI